ncbi:PH domain-containing protein [Haloarchaeobius sp. TZWWS8]|uniref:PH domain-containing protein n=1 Tax=Haloarchaeobius sp. TZWWS8 TaxID=3446121 RepID=UPI003EBBA0B8
METLHDRVRIQWILRTAVGGSVLALAVFLLGMAGDVAVRLPLAAGVFALVLGLGTWHAFALYRDWRFELQEDALYLERGVVTRVETAVPYVRVQHVDTQQAPLDRALGLSRVVVYTAGSRGADVTVPGLTPERARRLRNELRELAVAAEPEDAV